MKQVRVKIRTIYIQVTKLRAEILKNDILIGVLVLIIYKMANVLYDSSSDEEGLSKEPNDELIKDSKKVRTFKYYLSMLN